MSREILDPFGARAVLNTESGPVSISRLARLAELGLVDLELLPFSIRVWLEGLLRQCNGVEITEEHVKNLAQWDAKSLNSAELPFKPARVILQDFTGGASGG